MEHEHLPGLSIYPRSEAEADGTTYCLARHEGLKVLVVQGDAAGLEGSWQGDLFLAPLSAANAAVLRQRLPCLGRGWLGPEKGGPRSALGIGGRAGCVPLALDLHPVRTVSVHVSPGGPVAGPFEVCAHASRTG